MPNDIVKNMRLAQPDFSSLPVGDPGMGAKALDVQSQKLNHFK
jgi:hypothetical protein